MVRVLFLNVNFNHDILLHFPQLLRVRLLPVDSSINAINITETFPCIKLMSPSLWLTSGSLRDHISGVCRQNPPVLCPPTADLSKRIGNEQYMWHGTKRECTIGDDNTKLTACHLPKCGVCHILRATLDPSKASPGSMFGIGAYVSPTSSKSADQKYMKNVHSGTSRNLVIIRCAVAVGRTYTATKPMIGVTHPPSGYDSISGVKGYTSKGHGRGTLKNDETVVFKKDAILPVEIIVLRFPDSHSHHHHNHHGHHHHQSNPYSAFTRRLINITDGDWNKYPEAIRNTYKGEVLWTDGNDSHSFASAPSIRAYKVVRKDRNGKVIAEGYASASPFYFRLE
ncbi:hypothetical protein ONZ45_g8614 [Pleurotus djamor]|nr:hypothetical protein ONZ45_g8614 [Pleurotus djamor]